MRLKPSLQIRRELLRYILEGRFEADKPLPTIKELADSFNVSTKTVQKAVHALTAEGVIVAKRGVGLFVRSVNPQAGRIKRVGMLYPWNNPHYLENKPWPGETIVPFREKLEAAGLKLQPYPLAHLDRITLLESLIKLKLGALVLFEVDSDVIVSECRELRLPMVSLDYDAYRHGIPSAIFDNVFGVFQATQHLIGLGHRHIAFMRPLLSTPLNRGRILDWVEDERLKGYRVAMQHAGLEPLIEAFEHKDPEVFQPARALLTRRPEITALVCIGDWNAQQLAHEVLAMGLRIPEDVSIFGFGNGQTEFAPGKRISSVRLDMAGMAEAGARLLLDALKPNPPLPTREVVATSLVHYDSVAPVRAEAKR